MEIGKQFNCLNFEEYVFYIENHKSYTDFNTLGLYRSISENDIITLAEKIKIRELANSFFLKTFEFLQVKDPWTYLKVQTLGLEITNGDKEEMWRKIRINQEKILRQKRIRHQNFGEYSKHNCGYETCPMNGIMIKQGTHMAEYQMCIGNINKYVQKQKSQRRKSERKKQSQIIRKELDLE